MGGDPSNPPPELRPAWRSAFAAGWRLVAHCGWILFGESLHNNTRKMSKYAPDMAKHRFYIWLNNYHWLPMVALGILLLAIGGLPLMLWGICVRVVFGLHATWLVNSATHLWGSRRFATGTIPATTGGGPHHFRRRLAQQPSRPSHLGAARSGVVRVRSVVDRDQAPAIPPHSEVRPGREAPQSGHSGLTCPRRPLAA